jgi:hypothetical protein
VQLLQRIFLYVTQREQAAVLFVQDPHGAHDYRGPGILIDLFVRSQLAQCDCVRVERIGTGFGLVDRRTRFRALPVYKLVLQDLQEPGPAMLDLLQFTDALEGFQAYVLYQVLRI